MPRLVRCYRYLGTGRLSNHRRAVVGREIRPARSTAVVPGKACRAGLIRNEGFLSGGYFYSLSINGILAAARLDTSAKALFHIPAGEVILRAGRDSSGKGPCALDQSEWTQHETQLKPDEIKHFRMSIDANGKSDVQRALQ